jgi:DNA polymerase-4
VGAEDTFPYDLTDIEEMNNELDRIAQIVYDRMEKHGLKGRTITLKIKYSDFRQITRNRSFPNPLNNLSIIRTTAKELLASSEPKHVKIRLLGISLSNFGESVPKSGKKNDSQQLELF